MEEMNFKELFQKIVEHYELAPEAAEELQKRILTILNSTEDASLPSDFKYEILADYLEREGML